MHLIDPSPAFTAGEGGPTPTSPTCHAGETDIHTTNSSCQWDGTYTTNPSCRWDRHPNPMDGFWVQGSAPVLATVLVRGAVLASFIATVVD